MSAALNTIRLARCCSGTASTEEGRECYAEVVALAAEVEQLREKNDKLSKLIVEQEADYRERNRRLEAVAEAARVVLKNDPWVGWPELKQSLAALDASAAPGAAE